jgi:flagellar biosynthetic protein FliR
MEQVVGFLLPLIGALWWPFARIMAMFATAPVIGEGMVPLPVRALLALVLSFLMLPITKGAAMPDPFSLSGVVTMIEQAIIGGVLGMALQFAMAAVSMLGFLVSSQVGFSMAQMNDPVNGQPSDVVSSLLSLVAILVFFAIDGHLVLASVLGQSFRAWPVAGGYGPLLLQSVALNVGWVFSAAMLLAVPIVFSTMVVQVGFGFLNRVALMLGQVVRFIPDHYIAMTNQVLEMLQQQMRAAHG